MTSYSMFLAGFDVYICVGRNILTQSKPISPTEDTWTSQILASNLAYLNHTRIRHWNQPALNNESKVSCLRKQRDFDVARSHDWPITSQTLCPPRHAAHHVLTTAPTGLSPLRNNIYDISAFAHYFCVGCISWDSCERVLSASVLKLT